MKLNFFLPGLLLIFLIPTVKSQSMDSVALTIKGLNKVQVRLEKFGADTVVFTSETENLNTRKNSWLFKITTSQNVFVVINNFEGDSGLSDTIRKFDKVFDISNDMIVKSSFLLQENFSIEVRNAVNDTLIKKFDISYNQKGSPGSEDRAFTDGPSSEYKIGSAVIDAMYLANAANNPVLQSKILSYYGRGLTGQQLVDEYSGNKFLKGKATRLISKNLEQAGGINFRSITSAVGGLDITSIADGLAKFLVKRTKQELSISFFDKFKTFISKYADLRTVFPETYKALNIIGDEIYNYQAYIQTLRESFENDLGTLDKNLPSIIENHKDFFEAHPALAATLNSGSYIAGGLDDKVHPGDILNDYPITYLDDLYPNWKAAIQTLQVFSTSLRDTVANADSEYWVDVKQIKSLINDRAAFKIYLGLIYQEAKNKYDGIHYQYKNMDTTFTGLLNTLAKDPDEDYSSYKDFIVRFSEKTNKLNRIIKNYKKLSNDSLTFEQYYNYFNASIDLLQHCTEISKLKYADKIIPGLADSLKDYFDVVRSSANLVLDIRRRNYASAIVNSVHIYDLVKVKYNRSSENDTFSVSQISKANKKTEKDVTDIIKDIANGKSSTTGNEVNKLRKDNYAGLSNKTKVRGKELKNANKSIATQVIQWAAENPSLTITKDFVDSLERLTLDYAKPDDTLQKLYKYGAFMATMVQAKSSDEIENAIEAFALPTGSARIKRVSAFNISLNAYTGLYGGYEHINGIDGNSWKFNSYGVTAPVGIAVSRGHSIFFVGTGKESLAKGKKGWSSSLFLSLIDIGALAAFRFNDDSTVISSNSTTDTVATSQVPAIHLRDIISPGVFISLGIPKCPLSVNFGVQMGTNLRKITGSDNIKVNYSDKIYWRYSISFCVDIPILNFYTRSE